MVARMNPKKALGADSWHVLELRALPKRLLEDLARFLNMVEEAGAWPTELAMTVIALVPKEGAMTEAELRPIGLTPVIYRLWMCIRKPHIATWVRQLYGGKILSAVDNTWNTRVGQKLARCCGHSMATVYLDCPQML